MPSRNRLLPRLLSVPRLRTSVPKASAERHACRNRSKIRTKDASRSLESWMQNEHVRGSDHEALQGEEASFGIGDVGRVKAALQRERAYSRVRRSRGGGARTQRRRVQRGRLQ